MSYSELKALLVDKNMNIPLSLSLTEDGKESHAEKVGRLN
jgi:hypothetical protein